VGAGDDAAVEGRDARTDQVGVDRAGGERGDEGGVLILGGERCVASVELEVVGVLERGQLVGVEPGRPPDGGAGVHGGAVLAVEVSRGGGPAAVPQSVAPQLGVLRPQVDAVGPGVDELGPLPLPLGMGVAVEELVGEVAGLDHRDGA